LPVPISLPSLENFAPSNFDQPHLPHGCDAQGSLCLPTCAGTGPCADEISFMWPTLTDTAASENRLAITCMQRTSQLQVCGRNHNFLDTRGVPESQSTVLPASTTDDPGQFGEPQALSSRWFPTRTAADPWQVIPVYTVLGWLLRLWTCRRSIWGACIRMTSSGRRRPCSAPEARQGRLAEARCSDGRCSPDTGREVPRHLPMFDPDAGAFVIQR
jgi:hypothetical protein